MAETLVVASKVKTYIKDKAGMNTAASVADALSDKVREICDEAIANAQAAKRKTVRDSDIS
jgi:histone H3/H4